MVFRKQLDVESQRRMNRTRRLALHATILPCLLLGCAQEGGKAETRLSVAESKKIALDKDPNLVGWWKFDETAGRTAADSSPHNRKGVLKGGLSFDRNSAEGKIGKALKLSGKPNHYVKIVNYKGITGTKPRTITAWIKTEEDKGEIIAWGADDFGKMWFYRHRRGRVGVTPSGGYLYMNDKTDDNKWHHLAVVVQEAELPNLHDDVKLYKDGKPAEIHDVGLLDLWPVDTGKGIDVRIGRKFIGLLDDVRIYDRALSDDEVMAIFQLKSN